MSSQDVGRLRHTDWIVVYSSFCVIEPNTSCKPALRYKSGMRDEEAIELLVFISAAHGRFGNSGFYLTWNEVHFVQSLRRSKLSNWAQSSKDDRNLHVTIVVVLYCATSR